MKQTDTYKRKITRLLRSHGITPTAQRVKIAHTMLSRPQHLSADQLLVLTNKTGKIASKATVYNTLGLFAQKGLIRELVVDPKRTFYDSSTHPHHHFYNSDTHELSDITDNQVEVSIQGELPPGTEIDNVEVIIHLRSEKES